MKKLTRRFLVASTFLATAASAETVQVNQIAHVTPIVGKLRAVKVDGKDAVEVLGAGTPVRLDYRPTKTLTLAKVGIRHVDKGSHSFEVGLGSPRLIDNSAPASILDNFAPVASAKIVCNGFSPAAGATGGGAATITPRFAGSATFSVVVMKAGKTVKSLTGQSGAVTIADFDNVHDGHVETLGVTFGYGMARKGSWSMRIEHEDFVVTITADSPQSALAAGQMSMSTSGLDSITLVDHKLENAAL